MKRNVKYDAAFSDARLMINRLVLPRSACAEVCAMRHAICDAERNVAQKRGGSVDAKILDET